MTDPKINPKDQIKISNEPVYTPVQNVEWINEELKKIDPVKISNEPVYKPTKK